MDTLENRKKLDAYISQAPVRVLLMAIRKGYGFTSLMDRRIVKDLRVSTTRWFNSDMPQDRKIKNFLLLKIRQTNFQPNK